MYCTSCHYGPVKEFPKRVVKIPIEMPNGDIEMVKKTLGLCPQCRQIMEPTEQAPFGRAPGEVYDVKRERMVRK